MVSDLLSQRIGSSWLMLSHESLQSANPVSFRYANLHTQNTHVHSANIHSVTALTYNYSCEHLCSYY